MDIIYFTVLQSKARHERLEMTMLDYGKMIREWNPVTSWSGTFSGSFSCLASIKPLNAPGQITFRAINDIIDKKESFKKKEREREREKKTPQMVKQKISRLQRLLTSCLPSLAIFHNSIRETISLVVLLQSDFRCSLCMKKMHVYPKAKRKKLTIKNELDLYIILKYMQIVQNSLAWHWSWTDILSRVSCVVARMLLGSC